MQGGVHGASAVVGEPLPPPTVIGEAGGKMWKPSNYGGEFLGNITLRRALAMSRNVCTVRVLDMIGPDEVYKLAGPKLKIGYPEPTCSRTHIPLDDECNGALAGLKARCVQGELVVELHDALGHLGRGRHDDKLVCLCLCV